ncbi:MAG: IclR family transcriptional regulator [Pirellulales bacterium]|nr:IclR family transcriptional regulator [Pirellulales bacterium]
MESTSLVKALGLLEATANEPAGRPLAALAAETGLTKPTAHRILKTLTMLGYLERAGGVYRQTPKVQQLVSNDPAQRLLTMADPVLRDLHEKTLETVNLGALRFDRVVYLRVLESPQPLRRVATPDTVDPFHSTALGRAIAAHLPAAEQELLLKTARLEPSTPLTKTNHAALAATLAKVARDGYAIEADETDVGVTCIGAPIIVGGAPLAAVSLSMPTARAASKLMPKLVAAVRSAAGQIAAAMEGGRSSASGSNKGRRTATGSRQ